MSISLSGGSRSPRSPITSVSPCNNPLSSFPSARWRILRPSQAEGANLPAISSSSVQSMSSFGSMLEINKLEAGKCAALSEIVFVGCVCDEQRVEKGGFFGGRAPLGPDPNHQLLLLFFFLHSAIQDVNSSFFSGGT